MTTSNEQTQFLNDVYAEAARLLDVPSVLDLTVDAATPDVVWQCLEAGENACDVARQLVDDEVIR